MSIILNINGFNRDLMVSTKRSQITFDIMDIKSINRVLNTKNKIISLYVTFHNGGSIDFRADEIIIGLSQYSNFRINRKTSKKQMNSIVDALNHINCLDMDIMPSYRIII